LSLSRPLSAPLEDSELIFFLLSSFFLPFFFFFFFFFFSFSSYFGSLISSSRFRCYIQVQGSSPLSIAARKKGVLTLHSLARFFWWVLIKFLLGSSS